MSNVEPVADRVLSFIVMALFCAVISAPVWLLAALPFVYMKEQTRWPCEPVGIVKAISARCP